MNYRKAISDRLQPRTKTSAATVALALAGGVVLGAVISLLFAPQSGEETRGLIADKTKDLTDSVKGGLRSVKDKFRSAADHHTDHVKNGLHNES